MKSYKVTWSASSSDDLLRLNDWLANFSDSDTADRYIDLLTSHAEKLAHFPMRGTPRDDVGPGIRTTPFRRKTVIAYQLLEGGIVEIVRLIHAGQDWIDHEAE